MLSGKTRPPAVAGMFYPHDPVDLERTVRSLLGSVPGPFTSSVKALIVPHAGYIYSGPIAASAYAQWHPERENIRQIVLLGPSHYVALRGLAVPSASGFATPLGVVPLAQDAIARIRKLPQVSVSDEAHAREHSLEVQLPFLQLLLPSFELVPLVLGEAGPEEVAEVIDVLWGGSETRFLISSDLSHFYDYQTACRLDRATATAIESLDPRRVEEDGACGRVPIRGFLRAAARRHLVARAIDLRNSGDTAGPRERVVGYGAFTFAEPAAVTKAA